MYVALDIFTTVVLDGTNGISKVGGGLSEGVDFSDEAAGFGNLGVRDPFGFPFPSRRPPPLPPPTLRRQTGRQLALLGAEAPEAASAASRVAAQPC